MKPSTSKPSGERHFDHPRVQQERSKATGRQKESSHSQNDRENLGRIIAEGRKRLGWSQQIFALKSEYDEKTVSNVETGATRNPKTFCDLREVLNKALKEKGEDPIPWPSLETTLGLRKTSEVGPVIAASRISMLGRNAGCEHLIGRDNERKALDYAWEGNATAWQNMFNQQAKNGGKITGQPTKPRVIVFNAWAGIGKTSLIVKWAADKLATDNHSGIERYFDWSFYNQGTGFGGHGTLAAKASSADVFLKDALEFFGDTALAASNTSAWHKGEHLAKLIGQHRTLLVLDGIEPLQDPKTGELSDDGLRALLRGLVADNRGLCIITTRQHLPELAPWSQTASPEWNLDRLSDDAAVALLTELGVKGLMEEKRAFCAKVKGHALTITLLGSYLKHAHHGDIRCVDRVDFKKVNEKEQGGHAFRVMAAYERWFIKNKCRTELAILRMIGLFDRPATPDCLASLCAPPIPGLTDTIISLDEDDWNEAVNHLQKLNLVEELSWEPRRISGFSEKASQLIKQGKTTDDPKPFGLQRSRGMIRYSLDTHPLVREFFSKRLRESLLGTWKLANGRLYDHLEKCVPYWPEGLDGLQPLYQAVNHACQADLHQKACVEVYRNRILRGTLGIDAYYSWIKLGAANANLAAVSCFYEQLWKRPSKFLENSAQTWILGEAANYLCSGGRLSEAIEPVRVCFERSVRKRDWANAGIYARNLCEIELLLGNVSVALKISNRSVLYSSRTKELEECVRSQSIRANSLHQAGYRQEASLTFIEAECIQTRYQPQSPLLHRLQGFWYCELLLCDAERTAWRSILNLKEQSIKNTIAINSCLSIEQRIGKIFQWKNYKEFGLLNNALNHLTLGNAILDRAIIQHSQASLRSAKFEIDAAISGMRQAATLHELPRALLTSARLWAALNRLEMARLDLDEAEQIAVRGPMRLHLVDVCLHRARLFYDKAELKRARDYIEQCEFWRRKQELEDAEIAAQSW
ncbi:MAG: hypothetical protein P4M11_09975 [Candidatus Pacebacteria bacterium]|nr:hypothetical protein [Candidatus Paceibacterota bacterium]